MKVPLFPLGTVLFPGAPLPLLVFEDRYRQMMREVLASDRSFVVAAIRSGVEVGGYAETYDVACRGVVEQVERRADGSMSLVVRGAERVVIRRRLPDDPYPCAEVAPLPEEPGAGAEAALSSARRVLNRYLGTLAQTTGKALDAPPLPRDPAKASYAVAAALDIPTGERQQLLEAPTASARLRLAAEIARREAALLEALGPPAGHLEAGFSPN